MSKIVVVVASNREKHLQEFLTAWAPHPWQEMIILEDGPKRSFDLGHSYPLSVHHLSWSEMAADEEVLTPTPFSQCDAGIKLYGFWVALRLRTDIIISLDDDCHPFGPSDHFVTHHIAALSPRARWVPSVDGSPTRGVPYFNLGTIPGAVANMGLWRGCADHDAPQRLALHRLGYADHAFAPALGNRLMHPDHYWPFCGMNIAFRREIAPLMYMPKMGDGSPYGRFDDIWCGIILQRCCRHLGLSLSLGEPHIRHLRASDPLSNLEKEAPGIRANELFWKAVETTPLSTARHATPLSCAESVATHLTEVGQRDLEIANNETFAAYLAEEGTRMQSWCKMFRNAAWK
jgi:Reversibly glycosylated polypeptide